MFWESQPVTRVDDKVITEGLIADIPIKFQSSLPSGLKWCTLRLPLDLERIHLFLRDHYIESEISHGVYSQGRLEWLLDRYNISSWLVGIETRMGELVGLITGVEVMIKLPSEVDFSKLAEINFLCVHKKYRKHGLVPLLIEEIRRYIKNDNYKCAIYTIPIKASKPITEMQYYHYVLDVLGVDPTTKSNTMTYQFKELNLDSFERDWNKVYGMYIEKYYNSDFHMYQQFTRLKFIDFFRSRPDVCKTVMVTNVFKECIGYISYYYHLSVLKNQMNKTLKRASVYYWSVNDIDLDQNAIDNRIIKMFRDWLMYLKFVECDIDIVDCKDVEWNKGFIESLGFKKGTGKDNMCIYNYHCRTILSEYQGYFPV